MVAVSVLIVLAVLAQGWAIMLAAGIAGLQWGYVQALLVSVLVRLGLAR